MNFSRLLSARVLEFCEHYLPHGKKVLQEWKCGDVSGAAGDSLTVQLEGDNRGLWFDHGAGVKKGGNLFNLLVEREGSESKAFAEARRFLNLGAYEKGHTNGAPAFDPLKFRHPDLGFPNAAWAYRDANGVIFAYSCRFNLKEIDPKTGKPKKEFRPLRPNPDWQHPKWFGFKSPLLKPIYGLDRLAKRTEAPVLFVEGEKTADAAQKIFPDYVCISAMNGAAALSSRQIDLSPLLSRTTPMVLWRDNDPAGIEAMDYLQMRFTHAVRVILPPGLPHKWDLADPVPEGVSVLGLLDAALNPAARLNPESYPFRALGSADGKHHYVRLRDGELFALTADQHTELKISDLVPDSFWEAQGDEFRGGGVGLNYKKIAKHMFGLSHHAGRYSEDRSRGRGVWQDEGRIVVHAGDCLYVDGQKTPLSGFKSRNFYLRGDTMEVDLSHPLPASESQKLHEIALLLPFADPNSAWMFAGHLFVSIINGCLLYRPSAHIHGEPDSGKSWTVEHVIKPVWGPFCLQMAGSSSATSYRQRGQLDALTFLVDEFETEGDKAIQNVKDVLMLMRQSTTDTAAKIYRGTPGGQAIGYSIRSNFFFAALSVLPTGRADESRVTSMEIRRREDQEPFRALHAITLQTTARPAWCQGLQARAIKYARQILTATTTFASCIRERCGDARTGNQLGTLAAGCWMLSYDEPPSREDALAWVDSVGITAYKPAPEDSDHQRCLNYLLESRVRKENNQSPSVGRLLTEALSKTDTAGAEEARKHLLEIGIRVDTLGEWFEIANQHRQLSELFKGTRWSDKWKDQFSRLGDKIPVTRFGASRSRAVRLDRAIIFPLSVDSVDSLLTS